MLNPKYTSDFESQLNQVLDTYIKDAWAALYMKEFIMELLAVERLAMMADFMEILAKAKGEDVSFAGFLLKKQYPEMFKDSDERKTICE